MIPQPNGVSPDQIIRGNKTGWMLLGPDMVDMTGVRKMTDGQTMQAVSG